MFDWLKQKVGMAEPPSDGAKLAAENQQALAGIADLAKRIEQANMMAGVQDANRMRDEENLRRLRKEGSGV